MTGLRSRFAAVMRAVLVCALFAPALLQAQSESAVSDDSDRPAAARGNGSDVGKSGPSRVQLRQLRNAVATRNDELALPLLDALALGPQSSSAVADSLWDGIQGQLRRPPLSRGGLEAARLFCRMPDADLFERQLSLTRCEDDDFALALVALSELARRSDCLTRTGPHKHRSADATESLPVVLRQLLQLARHESFDRSFSARRLVVDAVARFRDPHAVRFLIDTLATHDGLVRYEAARHLRSLTGHNAGGFPDRWQEWWTRQTSSGQPILAMVDDASAIAGTASAVPISAETPNADSGDEIAIPWPGVMPMFFGHPIPGRRVVFVIDKSLSMTSTLDGVTRMEAVQMELEHLLDDLPDGTAFNLIAYNEELQAWAVEPLVLNAESRSEAIRFAWSLLPDRMTATYDALESALLTQPDIEQLVLLSDGRPTAGTVTNPEMIVSRITFQNQMLQVRIDAVGIDLNDLEHRFLSELTDSNNGQLKVIR